MRTAAGGAGGQSTMEFLVTFPLIFLFAFHLLKVALNFTRGYLVHYGAFMTARHYLVHDDDSRDGEGAGTAEDSARTYFRRLPIRHMVPGLGRGRGELVFHSGAGGEDPVFRGLHYTYDETFSYTKFLGSTAAMPLRSEAFIGREPTRAECLAQICRAMEPLTQDRTCGLLVTLSDNGC